jgi:hypothetical protein
MLNQPSRARLPVEAEMEISFRASGVWVVQRESTRALSAKSFNSVLPAHPRFAVRDFEFWTAQTGTLEAQMKKPKLLVTNGVCVRLALVVALLSCTGASQSSEEHQGGRPARSPSDKADHGRSDAAVEEEQIVAQALEEASAEFGVPLPILQAITAVQSERNQWADAESPHGEQWYGPMGIRDGEWLETAAWLIGETLEVLAK